MIPLSLSALLLFIIFAPVMLMPGSAPSTGCSPHACIVQYQSVTYTYGDWGAYFQTVVNAYVVGGSTPCEEICALPQYLGLTWATVIALFIADCISIRVVLRTLSSAPRIPTEPRLK